MRLIVTGATGLVGSEVIRQGIADPEIEKIISVSRQAPEIRDPKLETIIHKDFLDYSSLQQIFTSIDCCCWCLGISQSQVNTAEYETITYQYTVSAAKAMLAANPRLKFVFVSGAGADSSEKSRILFARVKGKTENALKQLPFNDLIIVRPGGIKPVHPNKNAPLVNRIMIPLFPLLELLAPSTVISSVQLAKVIIELAKRGSGHLLLENRELKRIGNLSAQASGAADKI